MQGSSQFVSNVVFARFVLGERITLRVIGATSIIVGGQVLIVMFAAHVSQNYTAVELMALYNRTYLVRDTPHRLIRIPSRDPGGIIRLT